MFAVVRNDPEPLPTPEPTFTIRSTEGHGTWEVSLTEARQIYRGLHESLGMQYRPGDLHLEHPIT